MIHAIITAAIASMAWPLGWHQEFSLFMAAIYIGREHAQAEYRSIKSFYGGKRANAPWWCGFEPIAWDLKSLLDWLGPLCIAILTSLI